LVWCMHGAVAVRCRSGDSMAPQQPAHLHGKCGAVLLYDWTPGVSAANLHFSPCVLAAVRHHTQLALPPTPSLHCWPYQLLVSHTALCSAGCLSCCTASWTVDHEHCCLIVVTLHPLACIAACCIASSLRQHPVHPQWQSVPQIKCTASLVSLRCPYLHCI
jgi:hypothetical protein